MMSEEKNDIRNRDFFRSIQRIGTWLSRITYPDGPTRFGIYTNYNLYN